MWINYSVRTGNQTLFTNFCTERSFLPFYIFLKYLSSKAITNFFDIWLQGQKEMREYFHKAINIRIHKCSKKTQENCSKTGQYEVNKTEDNM